LAESGCNGVLRGVAINTEWHIISNTRKTGVIMAGTQFVARMDFATAEITSLA